MFQSCLKFQQSASVTAIKNASYIHKVCAWHFPFCNEHISLKFLRTHIAITCGTAFVVNLYNNLRSAFDETERFFLCTHIAITCGTAFVVNLYSNLRSAFDETERFFLRTQLANCGSVMGHIFRANKIRQ